MNGLFMWLKLLFCMQIIKFLVSHKCYHKHMVLEFNIFDLFAGVNFFGWVLTWLLYETFEYIFFINDHDERSVSICISACKIHDFMLKQCFRRCVSSKIISLPFIILKLDQKLKQTFAFDRLGKSCIFINSRNLFLILFWIFKT